ncbi:AIPR family protein [Streptomyces sp. KMM 9044]|uniref:AIPR family protein n=1 Tax=Streptomyces sp. KMM 9044 TaxID=2744474 RepID=UPI0021516410|nr:AIPR family protein [Streptomyces sp. KMM 9044]WAX78284.1 AIPR family protein [Streptomyces sp. KMM 9044]
MTNPYYMRHLRKGLEKRFRPHIDMSDRAKADPKEEERAFLSRAVAALAVKHETGWSDAQAAAGVIDGFGDRGIDAVAVEERGEDRYHITLVQAKWSVNGTAGFGERELRALFRGLDDLRELEFHRFNSRIESHAVALETALDNPGTIRLVLALVTENDLHPNIERELKKGIEERSWLPGMIDYEVIDLRGLYQELLGDQAERKIELDVWLEGAGRETMPYEAFYGTVSVTEIAEWYQGDNRAHLFSRNLRDALDVSDVNPKIQATLLSEPQHFWYFSNGITLLCESYEPKGKGAFRPGAGVGFRLKGASVVNGAQTVDAIARAVQRSPGNAGQGRVLVRIISLKECPEGFGDRVTTAANTQNPVQERDFKSRDRMQFDLRDEFIVSLGLNYVIRRGEPVPHPAAGCTMTEAALALAATHRSPDMVARAKRDSSTLWEDRHYRDLFGHRPSAARVWRVVQLLREVRDALGKLRVDLYGRVASAAGNADLLIAHAIFQTMDIQGLDDTDEAGEARWRERLTAVPELTGRALWWFVAIADVAFGEKSQYATTVRTAERVQVVARRLTERLKAGDKAPDYSEYRVTEQSAGTGGRLANAVRVIVDAGWIAEGTVLEFRPVTGPDRRGLPNWLTADAKRSRAAWRNNKTKPLVWEADGMPYAPSTLARLMRGEAMGVHQQVQGTRYWHVPGEGSLADIAAELRAVDDLDAGRNAEE